MENALWHYLELRARRGHISAIWRGLGLTVGVASLLLCWARPASLVACQWLFLGLLLAVSVLMWLNSLTTLLALKQGRALDEILEAGLTGRTVVDTLALYSASRAIGHTLEVGVALIPLALLQNWWDRPDWCWTLLLGPLLAALATLFLSYFSSGIVMSRGRHSGLLTLLVAECILSYCLAPSVWTVVGGSLVLVWLTRLTALEKPGGKTLSPVRLKGTPPLPANPIRARESLRWLRSPWRVTGLLLLYGQPVVAAIALVSHRSGALALVALATVAQAFWLPAWLASRGVQREREAGTFEPLVQSGLPFSVFRDGWRRVAFAPVARLLLGHLLLGTILYCCDPSPWIPALTVLATWMLASLGHCGGLLGLTIGLESSHGRQAASRLMSTFLMGAGLLGSLTMVGALLVKWLVDGQILEPSLLYYPAALLALHAVVFTLVSTSLGRRLRASGWNPVPAQRSYIVLYTLVLSSTGSLACLADLGKSPELLCVSLAWSLLMWWSLLPLEEWIRTRPRGDWRAWVRLWAAACLLVACFVTFPLPLKSGWVGEWEGGLALGWFLAGGAVALARTRSPRQGCETLLPPFGALARRAIAVAAPLTLLTLFSYLGLLAAYRTPDEFPQAWLDIAAAVRADRELRRSWLASHPLPPLERATTWRSIPPGEPRPFTVVKPFLSKLEEAPAIEGSDSLIHALLRGYRHYQALGNERECVRLERLLVRIPGAFGHRWSVLDHFQERGHLSGHSRALLLEMLQTGRQRARSDLDEEMLRQLENWSSSSILADWPLWGGKGKWPGVGAQQHAMVRDYLLHRERQDCEPDPYKDTRLLYWARAYPSFIVSDQDFEFCSLARRTRAGNRTRRVRCSGL